MSSYSPPLHINPKFNVTDYNYQDKYMTQYTADSRYALKAATTTALNLKADLSSPAFTSIPTAPTAAVTTNTTQLATCEFVLANAGASTPAAATFTFYT